MTTPKTPAKAPAKKRGLGRGLEALLGPKAAAEAPPSLEATEADTLRTLPVDALTAGKYQPRKHWDADKLTELAESIKAQGVIQPIVVRERPDRTYEIIAGERRWRASKQAGLADVPVVVRNVEDRTVVAMALIENIQREDLNPLEEAQALQRLIDEFDLTHAQAAEFLRQFGRDEPHLAHVPHQVTVEHAGAVALLKPGCDTVGREAAGLIGERGQVLVDIRVHPTPLETRGAFMNPAQHVTSRWSGPALRSRSSDHFAYFRNSGLRFSPRAFTPSRDSSVS